MAFKKKKERGFKVKHMKQDDFDALMGLNESQLNAEFMKAKKNERAARKQAKDDDELKQLKDAMLKHKIDHPNTEKIIKLRAKIKELNQEMKEDPSSKYGEALEDYNALKEGFSNLTKEFTEKQKAIFYIIASREFGR